MTGSLRSSRRVLSSSEKCPTRCHSFHLNKFVGVRLERKLILWNVILRAMRNVGPGKETVPVGEDSGA